MNNLSLDNGLWFENGKLYTGTVIYGPPAGFPNGFIREKIKNGIREGLRETFISDEQLWIKEYYKEGKLHGIKTIYDLDDPTFAEKISNYSNGQLHGVSKAFWDKDTLSEISEWKNGKLHGVSELYDKKGNLEEREIHENGNLVKK
tara:strand:+ start:50 stop:487 length:438 start_codon:yes stop_codon:yes gene_type:complete